MDPECLMRSLSRAIRFTATARFPVTGNQSLLGSVGVDGNPSSQENVGGLFQTRYPWRVPGDDEGVAPLSRPRQVQMQGGG